MCAVPYAIETHALTKQYGPNAVGASNIEIRVERREIFGLLGPNGAGKTTTVKMLTTLLKPSSGTGIVGGWDVIKNAGRVRRVINYLPQQLTADDTVTGYENLMFYAKLYKLPGSLRRERLDEALELVGLRDRAKDLVSEYSGGMKRRLELASVLLNRPQILFLDEPTIGLDPRSRGMIWSFLSEMRDKYETTILLTTNYMDEADKLCDSVAIIDVGKVVVEGRPSELRTAIGGDVISLSTEADEAALEDLIKTREYVKKIKVGDGRVKLVVEGKAGEDVIPSLLADIKLRGFEVTSVRLQKASLDDVFTAYTGKTLDEAPMGGPVRVVNRARLLRAGRS